MGADALTPPFAVSLSNRSSSAPSAKEEEALRQAQGEREGRDAAEIALRRRWSRALAAFRRAEAKLARFKAAEARLPARLREWPAVRPLERRFGDLNSVRLAALRRLLRAPAPDLPALALKLDLAVDDQAWELTGCETCLEAMAADARRLSRRYRPA